MSAPTKIQIDLYIPTTAAGTDLLVPTSWTLPFSARVAGIKFTPAVAVTADNTNYTDLSVEVGGTEIASEQTTITDTGNLVAGTTITMALTASGTSLEVSPATLIAVKKTDAGTGAAISGTVSILLVTDRLGA